MQCFCYKVDRAVAVENWTNKSLQIFKGPFTQVTHTHKDNVEAVRSHTAAVPFTDSSLPSSNIVELMMQQNHNNCLFYCTHYSSLSKPGTYIAHNPTQLPRPQCEMWVCYVRSSYSINQR